MVEYIIIEPGFTDDCYVRLSEKNIMSYFGLFV